MDSLILDIRHSIRSMWRDLKTSALVLLTFALGIGCNTAIFAVLNSVLLHPLNYNNPDQLVFLVEKGSTGAGVSIPDYLDWGRSTGIFKSLALYRFEQTIARLNEPLDTLVARVSPSLFSVLAVQPIVGRTFLPGDSDAGATPVAEISESLWRLHFASDQSVVGKVLELDGNSYTIVGVIPKRSLFQSVEVWVPFKPTGSTLSRSDRSWHSIARLDRGATIENARATLKTIASQLEQEYPGTNTGWTPEVTSVEDAVIGNARSSVYLLAAASGLILLLGCANIANLRLVRLTSRQKEMAIRLSLGSGRMRLVRQLLTESASLAVLGGAIGVPSFFWARQILTANLPSTIPHHNEIAWDPYVLGFGLLVAILSGLLAGIVPALQTTTPKISLSLKEGGSSPEGCNRRRIREYLVLGQVAAALTLVIIGSLVVKSFFLIRNTDLGFDPSHMLVAELNLSSNRYKTIGAQNQFFGELTYELERAGGVRDVGAVSDFALGGVDLHRLVFADTNQVKKRDALYSVVTAGYFGAMGIQLLRGRQFTVADNTGTMPVAVVSATAATALWPAENPLGRRVRLDSTWVTVVGVVKDTKRIGLVGFDQTSMAHIYVPYRQDRTTSLGVLVIRTPSEPREAVSTLRSSVWRLDRDIPLSRIQTGDDILWEVAGPQRQYGVLLSVFAVLSIVLASVGIYGVVSSAVSQRNHEIGVRMALGAMPKAVLGMVIKQGMQTVLIGIGTGLILAGFVTRFLRSLLYGVTTTDLATFVGTALALILIGYLACYIPARRVTRVDPLTVLRYE